ncbi:hypothetical protein BD749_3873, partial [Pontibacter ramchanderi]
MIGNGLVQAMSEAEPNILPVLCWVQTFSYTQLIA